MKAKDIVIQLRTLLPQFTTLFNDVFEITSLTRIGNTITGITSLPHGITAQNNGGRITGAYTPFEIISLTNDGNGLASGETKDANDLTLNYQSEFEIIGADQPEYNGTIISQRILPKPLDRKLQPYELYSVDNRKNFQYGITGIPISPATGTIFLIQNFLEGYNGWHTLTRISDTEFSYEVIRAFDSPAYGNNIQLHNNFRITRAVNIDRAFEAYTKDTTAQNKTYLYVTLEQHEASRETHAVSDVIHENLYTNAYHETVQQNFNVYAIIPCKNTIAAAQTRDEMEDLAKNLYKCLLTKHFPVLFEEPLQYGTTLIGHRTFDYVRSIYIHEFNFQQPYLLYAQDAVESDNSVAFRDLTLQIRNSYESELLNQNIDLDDKPLG